LPAFEAGNVTDVERSFAEEPLHEDSATTDSRCVRMAMLR
jgi:hypothetical protein